MTAPAMRGGSWFSVPPVQLPQEPPLGLPLGCRAASRLNINPADVSTIVGFRVVCLPPGVPSPRMVPPLRMIVRGGSRVSHPGNCCSAFRSHARPGFASYDLGFRVVCLPREVSTARCDLSLRGGSWNSNHFGPADLHCRSFSRGCDFSECTDSETGFRVVCLPPEVKPTQVAIRGGSHARLNYPWCRSTVGCRSACRGVCHSPDYAYDDIGFRVICLPRGMTP